MKETHTKRGNALVAVALAVAVVLGLSFVPWSDLTGGNVSDYDLLSDLFPSDSAMAPMAANEFVDPELEREMEAYNDSMQHVAEVEADTAVATIIRKAVIPHVADANPRVDGLMVIEDFTPEGRGLARLRQALATADEKPVRIAVMGDSYIEGDIFTQDIRDQLQADYGGRGVGYVPAHSQVSGFRRTVSQSDNGWTQHGIAKASGSPYFNVAGEYFTAPGAATITYKGYAKDPRLARWNTSRLLFIAPNPGRITMVADTDTLVADVEASHAVQQLTLSSDTRQLKITTEVPGLIFLGAWLEDSCGVVLDCMSIRGVSGITHRKLSTDLAAQMRRYTDYDLIVLEYGINALTAEQHNYNHYSEIMKEVAERVKQCYPGADVLMLGIGDRGQKVGGEVHSLPTAANMVDAQRKAAREAGILFWDTREAMGGDDAVVDWRERKLVNGDYIHLNSAGGKVLATELVNSINRMLND